MSNKPKEDQLDLEVSIKFEYEGLTYDEAKTEYDRVEQLAIGWLYQFDENKLATIKEFFLKQLPNVKTNFGDSLTINDLYNYLFTGKKETKQINIAYGRFLQSLMQRFEPKSLQDHQFGARMLAHLREMNLAIAEINIRGRELGQILVKHENEIAKSNESEQEPVLVDVDQVGFEKAPPKKSRKKPVAAE